MNYKSCDYIFLIKAICILQFLQFVFIKCSLQPNRTHTVEFLELDLA